MLLFNSNNPENVDVDNNASFEKEVVHIGDNIDIDQRLSSFVTFDSLSHIV